jgi:GNAT superfamily N-acetyltransferase
VTGANSGGVCQCCVAGLPGVAVRLVDESNSAAAVRFLGEWLCEGESEARRYLTQHMEPDGISLIATSGGDAVGFVAIIWQSGYAGFRTRGIPLVHQISVSEPWRRRGVGTMLMDAAEKQAVDRGIATLGITVGLFDEYGPAQRMYGRRGYIPDGRGSCQGQRPLAEGTQVRLDHDVIIWLTKDITTVHAHRPPS